MYATPWPASPRRWALPVRASAAACVALGAVLAGCGASPLPPRLTNLPRSRVLAGEPARRQLAHLHGRDVAPTDSFVAEYGRGALRLYLSRFSDAVTAQRELARMLDGLRGARSPFARPAADPRIRGRWTTVAAGAHHVFWVAGRTMFWLEGHPAVEFTAADQLGGLGKCRRNRRQRTLRRRRRARGKRK